ncbi:MAG: LemA family protein [Bdellovibrionales bacterium GWA2_49_15]|nr:MAG: LemA family protein [Bdellovibrionales bacterium GWA2_49_15]HAZ14888.1 LemA family protein [Bdellovibrionales bacterium]
MRIFLLILCLTFSACGMRSIPLAENQVEAAWADVLSQYKRRADLVPNLVSVVKGYATHEKETLEAVINARAKATQMQVSFDQLDESKMQQFTRVQAELSSSLSRLLVSVEKYPDLKANENFKDLQAQLEGTENRITVSRNRYIEAIKEFNNQITVPPTSWYNALFLHKTKRPQFALENLPQLEHPPEVKF